MADAGATATGPARRADLQVLRAWAIAVVIAHHARLAALPGGFLGVDAFYVLSGFLMAGIIGRGLADGSFTLRGFYRRRAHRLFPAAAATLALVAIAAPFLIDGFELRDLAAQMAGAVTFTANLVLWRQTDYFSSGATLKPLLHMWSLAVEEQFYLLLPLTLLWSPRRWRLAVLAAAALASLALCLWAQPRSPATTFFLLPTRAWEPLAGCLVALAAMRWPGLAMPRAWRWLAIAALATVPFLADESGHPGGPALAVGLASTVLCWPGGGQPGRWARPLVALGDRSYTLYLVHWPLIAFANNLWAGPPPGGVLAAMVALTFVLGEAQYRWVERVAAPRARARVAIGAAVAVMAAAALGTAALAMRVPATVDSRAANLGLGLACASAHIYAPRPACASGPAPRLLLWGDSLAMHLEPGLAAQVPGGVAEATRWVCGPLLGIAPVNPTYGPHWARTCLAWNRSVVASLLRPPAPGGVVPGGIVVLGSAFVQYAPGAEARWSLLVDAPGGGRIEPRSQAAVIAAIARTVAAIHAGGRRAVIVAPPPGAGVDSGRCHVRRMAGLPTYGIAADCRFARAAWLAHAAPVRALLAEVARRGIVPVIDPGDVTCPGAVCETAAGTTPLYRDELHLSVAGSRWLAARMGLAARIAREAR